MFLVWSFIIAIDVLGFFMPAVSGANVNKIKPGQLKNPW